MIVQVKGELCKLACDACGLPWVLHEKHAPPPPHLCVRCRRPFFLLSKHQRTHCETIAREQGAAAAVAYIHERASEKGRAPRAAARASGVRCHRGS